ncbi:GNAT family N-acetyltransferase [Thermobifida alba]|jgi:putative acetyltransferase|uniref:GNAT family N-acetyltransferase n=1 Tax=Thermobifida alba TaxID=53522 RepID=A0ABY4KXB2_THEAE|nr:GNAT family N-acetyltransferase [Thermobifida alba]
MLLRAYSESDARETLDVFTRAVQVTARRDYSQRQVDAWAGPDRNLAHWHDARASTSTQVAVIDGRLVGFIGVSPSGYIGMLFVDPSHQRQGVASALLRWAREHARMAGAGELSTHASITARPFFESHGFAVDNVRTPTVRGVAFRNYQMSIQLD